MLTSRIARDARVRTTVYNRCSKHGRSQRPGTVHELLEEIRLRPGMWLGETAPLDDIQTLMHGYYAALLVHGIVEPFPAMSSHFSDWLRLETTWSMSCGWAAAIKDHC